MSKSLILVDSSAWVTHLTGQPSRISRHIQALLTSHRVAINAIIRLEVLTGARDEVQYRILEDTLLGLHVVPLSDATWQLAERLRFTLRRDGLLVPVPDLVIACSAIVHGCPILHMDRHFDLMARHAPLKIYQLKRSRGT